jgi:hypothetical protein
LTTAKTETEGEKKAHIAAQTETLDALRDPQVQKTLAQAGLDRERRVLLGIKEGIERDKAANGGLTAAGRVTAKAKLAQFAVQMAAQQKDANYSVGAEQARHRQAIKTLQEMSDSVRADLDRGTADKAYPPNSKIKLKTGEVIQTDANGKPIAQPNADANSPF